MGLLPPGREIHTKWNVIASFSIASSLSYHSDSRLVDISEKVRVKLFRLEWELLRLIS